MFNAATDFFVIPTVGFRLLYIWFIIDHGRWRIIHFNDNSAGLRATAAAGNNVGGFLLPPGQTVGLSGDVEVDNFAPFVGLGWDSTFTSDSSWSVIVQGGVLYQGDPDVTLRQTSGPAISQSDLDAAARDIEDELDILRFYPVISIGLTYRF